MEAIKLGPTAVGFKNKAGNHAGSGETYHITFAGAKQHRKNYGDGRTYWLCYEWIGSLCSTLVEHARVETQNHSFSYGEPMSTESTTQTLCDLTLRFGEGDEDSMSRPFGVSLLIAGHDENGPCLYYTDPSGTFWQCDAKSIGSGVEAADIALKEQYRKDMTLGEERTNEDKRGHQNHSAETGYAQNEDERMRCLT
jgi:20S proteasome subunit alpha 5